MVESKSAIEREQCMKDADAILKDLESHIRETRGLGVGGRGDLTPSIVRKTLELAKNSESYSEFKLRFSYMVARNVTRKANTPLERFYENVINTSKGKFEHLRNIMEYVVMKHTVLSKL